MNVSSPVRSYGLVLGQFGCLLTIAVSGPLIPSALPLLALQAIGLFLGGWALITMRLHRLSVLPDPLPRVELVRSGPYRFIRHPMYASLLIVALGWVLAAPHLWRWLLWLGLVAILTAKLLYEERLLRERLSDYQAYQRRSWRLLPFVW